MGEGERAVELEPQSPMARWQLGRALLFALCFALARSDDRRGAEAIRDRLIALAERSWVSPYDLAVCVAGLAHHGAALDHSERAFHRRVMRVIAIGDPEFDGLRGERRFTDLVGTLRLPMPAILSRTVSL